MKATVVVKPIKEWLKGQFDTVRKRIIWERDRPRMTLDEMYQGLMEIFDEEPQMDGEPMGEGTEHTVVVTEDIDMQVFGPERAGLLGCDCSRRLENSRCTDGRHISGPHVEVKSDEA